MTSTTRTAEFLRAHADFYLPAQIAAGTGDTVAHVTSALFSLKGYKVVDAVEQGGKLWWFALPPEDDTRQRVHDERTPETKPRRTKRRKPPQQG